MEQIISSFWNFSGGDHFCMCKSVEASKRKSSLAFNLKHPLPSGRRPWWGRRRLGFLHSCSVPVPFTQLLLPCVGMREHLKERRQIKATEAFIYLTCILRSIMNALLEFRSFFSFFPFLVIAGRTFSSCGMRSTLNKILNA